MLLLKLLSILVATVADEVVVDDIVVVADIVILADIVVVNAVLQLVV